MRTALWRNKKIKVGLGEPTLVRVLLTLLIIPATLWAWEAGLTLAVALSTLDAEFLDETPWDEETQAWAEEKINNRLKGA